LLTLGTALALSGAGAAPAQTPAPPAANPSPSAPASPTGPSAAVPVSPAPLTLPAAATGALGVNPSVLAATQQLTQAQARLGQAEAQARLQLSFNSTLTGSNAAVIQPPPSHESFYTLQNSLTLPIPVGSRQKLAIMQARAQVEAAQAQFQSARLALLGQLVTAYYDVLRKQALLQVAQDNLAQAQRQLEETRRRKRAGDVADLDVIRAQSPVASAQSATEQAQTALAIARQTLNGLLGRGLDVNSAVAEITAPTGDLGLTLDQAREIAARISPDVRAAEATVRAQEAALASSRQFRLPTLSLQASDTRSNDQTGFSRVDSIQASVTLPLTDGGLGKAQVREAIAALAQSRVQAAAARQTALTTVSAAYLTATASRCQVAAAQAARDLAQTIYDKTLLGYQNGLFPFTDVLNAQSALNQARIALAQSQYDAAVALATLNLALGKDVQ